MPRRNLLGFLVLLGTAKLEFRRAGIPVVVNILWAQGLGRGSGQREAACLARRPQRLSGGEHGRKTCPTKKLQPEQSEQTSFEVWEKLRLWGFGVFFDRIRKPIRLTPANWRGPILLQDNGRCVR